jgi:hypothetical protein
MKEMKEMKVESFRDRSNPSNSLQITFRDRSNPSTPLLHLHSTSIHHPSIHPEGQVRKDDNVQSEREPNRILK